MRKVFLFAIILMVAASCHAQPQIPDMKGLVGRKAIAQRTPFYQPGTYKETSNDYAGQTVTIIAVKPSATFASFLTLSASVMRALPPESRAAMENLRNAATIIVQFADGTKADTGATPVMPSMLSSYLELIPEQEPATQATSSPPIISAPSIPVSSGVANSSAVVQSIITPLLSSTSGAAPRPGDLTDEQVSAAIYRATHGRRHSIGLTLNDVQMFFLSGMLCDTCGTSGYTVTIYTPELWIEQLALNAQSEMLPFTVNDITPEMRRPDLRVVALPSRADYITGAGLSMASSVHRVVLNNADRTETIQPLQSENGMVEGNSAFRSVTYTSASASFPMSEVIRLQAQDKRGEFFVVVVGDNQNKFFKVKARFMKQLFGSVDH